MHYRNKKNKMYEILATIYMTTSETTMPKKTKTI